MSRDRVDFTSRHREPLVGWIVLTLGAIAFIGSITWYLDLRAERLAAREAISRRAQAQREAIDAAKRRAAPTPDDKRRANALRQTAEPWQRTLAAIEQATQDPRRPIFLLSWTMDAADRRIQLEGEATSIEAVVEYVDRLNLRPNLAEARIVNHEQVKDAQSATSSVKFSATATWRQP